MPVYTPSPVPRWERILARFAGANPPNFRDLPNWRAALYVLLVDRWNRWTKAQPRQVNFCIIGAQKAGTSALATYLKSQPDVLFSSRKEVMYFAMWRRFREGLAGTPQWYHRHFNWRNPAPLVGEASPNYFAHKNIAARVATYNPAMKLIVILRDPAERLRSAWNMDQSKGRTTLDLLPWAEANPLAVEMGRYGQWIRVWKAHFPSDQIHFIHYETYRTSPGSVLPALHAFLGLPAPLSSAVPPRRNVHPVRPAADAERAALLAMFADDIEEVEALLGWDCSDWKA